MGDSSDSFEPVEIEEFEEVEVDSTKPEDSKKRKAKSTKEPPAKKPKGRPAAKEKYKFNNRDKAILEDALKKFGNSYATIAKEYFSDCEPAVTRADIANCVNSPGNTHLKKLCQTGYSIYRNIKLIWIELIYQILIKLILLEHKKIKEESHKTFLENNLKKKENINYCDSNNSSSLFPDTQADGESVIVPNINFLAPPPFFVKRVEKYVYFYRLHLAQDLDVDYDSENRLLRFEIISNASLLPCEKFGTNLYNEDPDFQAIESEEKLKVICHIKVPDDARLDDSIFRKDVDNDTGALVEVHPLRKKEEDKTKLKGKRNRHMNVIVSTTTPLKHHPENENENGEKERSNKVTTTSKDKNEGESKS